MPPLKRREGRRFFLVRKNFLNFPALQSMPSLVVQSMTQMLKYFLTRPIGVTSIIAARTSKGQILKLAEFKTHWTNTPKFLNNLRPTCIFFLGYVMLEGWQFSGNMNSSIECLRSLF